MNQEPVSLIVRLFNACVLFFLGAACLYGAVLIAQSIWPWLCVGAVVIGLVGALLMWSHRSRSPW